MGRPKAKEAKKQYTIMLKPSDVKEIDRLAGKLELSRSQLMANLVKMGLDDARVLEKMGVVNIIKVGEKIANKMKNAFLSGKAEISEDGSLEFKE